jgi:hypothetical protein
MPLTYKFVNQPQNKLLNQLPNKRQTWGHSKKLHKPQVKSRIRQHIFSQRVIND